MSYEDDNATAEEHTEDATPDAVEDGTDWKAEAERWKRFSRLNEERAKESARKLSELSEQGKSENEKLAERIKQLEEEASRSQAEALRSKVAASKGLTATQAKYLQGSTEEELAESADELLKSFRPKVRDFGGGDRGTTIPSGKAQLSKESLKDMTYAEINEARREGRLNKVMRD